MKGGALHSRAQAISWLWLRSGCLFLVPYVVLYLVGWWARIPTRALQVAYAALHAWFLYVALRRGLEERATVPLADALFWLFLALAFFIPGAYFEFPSDSWEHASRIFLWNDYEFIHLYPTKTKQIYFWAWSLIGWVPLSYRFAALDLYGAFWQLLVSKCVMDLLEGLGLRAGLRKVTVLVFFMGFGTDVFGFRYYCLSSMVPAYTAYLFALNLVLDHCRGGTSRKGALALAALVIAANHFQELLFLVMMAMSLAVLSVLVQERSASLRKPLLAAVALLTLFSVIFPQTFVGAIHSLNLPRWIPQAANRGWDEIRAGLSPLLTLKLLDPADRHLRTLGALGLVSVLLAPVAFRRYPHFVWLVWTPIALALWPPFALALSALASSDARYRIYYALPAILALPSVIDRMFQLPALRSPVRRALVIALLLAAFFLPYHRLSGGRAFFQFFNSGQELWLRDLRVLAEWADGLPKKCYLVTDHITGWALQVHGKRPEVLFGSGGSRLNPHSPLHDTAGVGRFFNDHDEPKVCAFIVRKPEYGGETVPLSRLGAASGHWRGDHVRAGWTIPPETRGLIEQFAIRAQWKRVLVLPEYEIWLPPHY